MIYYYNDRQIQFTCFTHAIQFGVNSEVNRAKLNKNDKLIGTCDICEALGTHDIPQTVYRLSVFGGLRGKAMELTTEGPKPRRFYTEEEKKRGVDKEEKETERVNDEIEHKKRELQELQRRAKK